MEEDVYVRPLVDAATEASLVEEYNAIAAELDTCADALKACSTELGFRAAFPAYTTAREKKVAFVLRTYGTRVSPEFRHAQFKDAVRMSACDQEIRAIGEPLCA
jgi:hypothetical protein